MTLFDDKNREHAFDRFFEQEKGLEPNPFMATRILQYIDTTLASREPGLVFRKHRLAQPITAAISLLLALFIGFALGKMGSNNQTAVPDGSQTLEILKSDLFIHDFVDDNKTFLSNN